MSLKRLEGRVAIVTGGGQGIGLGIATALAKEGANIVLTGRTLNKLRAAAASIEGTGTSVHCVAGSVAERESAVRATSEAISVFGRLDILVNNAHTFTPTAPLDQMPEENFRINLESGLFGTFHSMRAAFPHLSVHGGSIINLGSYNGLASPLGYAAYSATKEAIRALLRTASREWGRVKIRVNVINPAALSPTAAAI